MSTQRTYIPLLFAVLAFGLCAERISAQCTTISQQSLVTVGAAIKSANVTASTTQTDRMNLAFSSSLAKPQLSASIATTCAGLVTFQVYTATASKDLDALSALSATNPDFALPKGVRRTACGYTRSGDVITGASALLRSTLGAVGTTMFYRIAKRVDRSTGTDATLWDATRSFVVVLAITQPPVTSPVVNAGADQTITWPASTANLAATATTPSGTIASRAWTRVSGPNTPTFGTATSLATTVSSLAPGVYILRFTATNSLLASASDDVQVTVIAPDLQPRPSAGVNSTNRPLFKRTTGSYGVANETFPSIPKVFCAGLTGGTLVRRYKCGTDSCDEFRHSISLPAVTYNATNAGNAAAGQFTVTLSAQTSANGSTGTLAQVATQTVTGLNAGANAANFSYTPPGTVDVYRFPGDNADLCFVRCDPNQGDCKVPFEEIAYLVRVDGGNPPATGQVPESNEGNNEGSPIP